MTVTYETPQYLGPPGSWRVSWTSDVSGATFYVYRDGILVSTQTQNSIVINVASAESPVIYVLDETPTAANRPGQHPGRVTLTWLAPGSGASVDFYKIEENIASTWTERKRIVDDGSTYYRWTSRFLEDGQTHQFRVRAVGDNGNESTVESLDVLVVRYPDPPEVDFEYDAGTGKVTVSAA